MFYQVAARDNDSALTHRGCPSVRLSVCPSVRLSPKCNVIFSKAEPFRAMVSINDL